MPKQYASASNYEEKLKRVMERLNIKEFDWNYDRHGAWVEFKYKGSLYRFDHSVEKAKSRGVNISYGSDAFSQIVLALEDLARMVERGIYDLQTWVAGMKYLPPVLEMPVFFKVLGFEQIPSSEEEIKTRYRNLSKTVHPDMGGSAEDFNNLTKASEQCLQYLKSIKK